MNIPLKELPPTNPDGIITIKGLIIPYHVQINPRRKYPGITIYNNGRLIVEIPGPVLPDVIIHLIEDNKDWIYREYYKTLPECPPDNEIRRLIIGDEYVRYQIRRSAKAKRMILKILHNGVIEVTAPFDMGSNRIEAFVTGKREWIASQIGKTCRPDSLVISGSDNQLFTKDNEECGTVEYNGHVISYKIKRSRRTKRTIIKIGRDQKVTVVAPGYVPSSDIHAFTRDKAGWIYKHTTGSQRSPVPERKYCDGEIWPWYGSTVTLKIELGEKPWAEIRDNSLCMTLPYDTSPALRTGYIKSIMKQFFSYSLLELSKPYFRKYSDMLNVEIPEVKTRLQETKWGTCTSRSIILNLKLCMAPPDIIEYVVVHELCHLVHRDHSERYWNTLEGVLPDYKERREFLKKNGYLWSM